MMHLNNNNNNNNNISSLSRLSSAKDTCSSLAWPDPVSPLHFYMLTSAYKNGGDRMTYFVARNLLPIATSDGEDNREYAEYPKITGPNMRPWSEMMGTKLSMNICANFKQTAPRHWTICAGIRMTSSGHRGWCSIRVIYSKSTSWYRQSSAQLCKHSNQLTSMLSSCLVSHVNSLLCIPINQLW